jgi:hypothetical protein
MKLVGDCFFHLSLEKLFISAHDVRRQAARRIRTERLPLVNFGYLIADALSPG